MRTNLILALLGAVAVLLWKLRRDLHWYANVSIPWFNNIGQKIGLDNAHIPEPPIQG